MKEIKIIVGGTPTGIKLRRRAENDVLKVIFDVSKLVEEFGDGTAVLLTKRPSDVEAHPVTTVRNGVNVEWTVSSTELYYAGTGRAELFWYVGTALSKTEIWTTYISDDIGPATSMAPDPYEDWVESLTGLGEETQANAERAEAALKSFLDVTCTAATLPAGSSATASYNNGVISFGIPKGDKGDTGAAGSDGKDGKDGTDGQNGADGHTPVKGVDYWTSEDKAEIVSDVLDELPTWEGGSY